MFTSRFKFLLLLAVYASAQTSEYVEAQFASDFRLGWQFYGDEIVFKLSCDVKGWCGFGFGSDMLGTDCISGAIGDQPYVFDLWCETEDTPPLDVEKGGSSDLTVINGTYSGGTTEIYFSRKLDTGDQYDFVITENVQTDYIWAYYPSSSFVDHQNNYGLGSFNLATTQASLVLTIGDSSYSDDYEHHGQAMTVIWMGLMPIGIIFARYFKWTAVWFYVHVAVGWTTIIITYISTSLTIEDNEASYATLIKKKLFHSRLGFSVVSLVIGQGLFGLTLRLISRKTISPYKLKVMRDVHFFTGWTLVIIAFIEIYYGWDLYDDNDEALPIVYFFYAFIAFLFAVLELWRRFWYLIPALGCRKSSVKMTHQEVLKEVLHNNKKLAFCDELVISVGHFAESHPGGERLISESYGEDLGKYINGCSGFGKGSMPYYHSQGARLMLERLSIGVLAYPSDFILGRSQEPSYEEMSWQLVGKLQIAEATQLLSYAHKDFYVAKPTGVSWIGKHLRITKNDKYIPVHRYYSIVYCMSPVVLQQWSAQIEQAGFEVQALHQHKVQTVQAFNLTIENAGDETSHSIQADNLTMIIKEYKPHGTVSQYACGMEIGSNISLKGPLGPGLALTHESSGIHVGFAGGTGLVPYLDLVHLIWRTETQQEASSLPDDFYFLLYVSFNAWKFAFAIDLLKATHELCERNKSRRFILHLFVNETTEQGKMTPAVLKEYIDLDQIATVWACGPSPFNRWVCDMMVEEGVARSKVILL
jgi:NAD(P)H-flavin reductase